MKIDNIINKEKSPDNASIALKTSNIDDIKKIHKLYDFNNSINDLKSTNINNNNNINQEPLYNGIPPTTSKLKKLLLNNDPEVVKLNNITNEKLQRSLTGVATEDSGFSSSVNNSATTKNNNNVELVKSNYNNINGVSNSNSDKLITSNNATTYNNNNNNINNNKQKLFVCSECHQYFLKLNLFAHIKAVHNKFTCLYCYGFFANIEGLERHLVKKHKVHNSKFFDEQSLHNYLNTSCANNIGTDLKPRSIKAVCCKCGSIFSITDNFNNHCCSNETVKLKVAPVKEIIKKIDSKESIKAVQNDLNHHNVTPVTLEVNQMPQQPSVAQNEDPYFEQAIQEWLQPNSKPTFNGNLFNNINSTDDEDENSSPNITPTPESPTINNNNAISSHPPNNLSYRHDGNNSWRIEQDKIADNDTNLEGKLVVPKLKLQIPKSFQNQSHYFDNMESDEDSGDEDSSSDEENDHHQPNKESFNNQPSKSNKFDDIYSSSLSENENDDSYNDLIRQKKELQEALEEANLQIEKTNKPNSIETNAEVVKSENPPSLKIKIKNIGSNNPEMVLDSHDFSTDDSRLHSRSFNESPIHEQTNDVVDMTEQPMDIEEPIDTVSFENTPPQLDESGSPVQRQLPEEINEPLVDEQKSIIIDNIPVILANEDTVMVEITLNQSMETIPIRSLLKICLKSTIPYCLYCNHARKIVVSGKNLAIHFLTMHRFNGKINDVTIDELHSQMIVDKIHSSIGELENSFFNLDTFDNNDEDKKEGNVTISHDKLYECFQCRFQTPIHKDLYLHNRKMHQKSLIICLMCKVNFLSYSELVCHICPGVSHVKPFLDYKFHCCLCNMDNIPSAFRLMVHLRKKHFACDVCLEKCSDQNKLSSHVWKHKLHHFCYRCKNINYRNKADIMRHLFWKHGTEGVTCKKCLQKKWPHVYHFCIPPNAFTCEQCSLSFTKAMALKVHQRLHVDGAKYPCTELNCDKKFVSRKLLLQHVERHNIASAAIDGAAGGSQEANKKVLGAIVVPTVIPESQCCRTMPIVFRASSRKLMKLAAVARKNEKPMEEIVKEPEIVKTEEEPKEEQKELPALPDLQLNLSESDSSDDDEMPAVKKEKFPMKKEGVGAAENLDKSDDKTDLKVKTLQDIAKPSSLSDSDDDSEDGEEDGTASKKSDDKVWDNFKTFQENQQTVPSDEEINLKEKLKQTEAEKPTKMNIHVVQSDHDYSKMYKLLTNNEDDLENLIKVAKIEKDGNKEKHVKNENESSKKTCGSKSAKGKVQKVHRQRQNNDFGSSSSDSDDSSDCSCNTDDCNCSSSSSSSSSSSDSSVDKTKLNIKPKQLKEKRIKIKKIKKPEEPEVVVEPVVEEHKDPDDIIYESDLVTDESETDEDFYDEHPQKLESFNLAIDLENNEGIVENSHPSTPSLPPDEMPVEKRLKVKKRKKDRKSSESPRKRSNTDAIKAILNQSTPFNGSNYFNSQMSTPIIEPPQNPNLSYRQTSTPIIPRMELHQESEIRQLLQTNQQQPVLPILKANYEQQQQQLLRQSSIRSSIDYMSMAHSKASSASNSRKNSESDTGNIKRSQRRRIPNKFYGYGSDDDTITNQSLPNVADPFKPVPPPILTWNKDDLPASPPKAKPFFNKSLSAPATKTIAPLKLNLSGIDHMPSQLQPQEYKQQYSMYDQQQSQQQDFYRAQPQPQQQIPKVPLHQNVIPYNMGAKSDSDSSDEGQLYINAEPRKRKVRQQHAPNPHVQYHQPSHSMQSQSNLYPFHVLETPSQHQQQQQNAPPPIPKLKLTIGNNNKIRRRNINPTKAPRNPNPAKKRKITPAAAKRAAKLNSSAPAFQNYSKKAPAAAEPFQNQSLVIPSASFSPPTQLLKSPSSSLYTQYDQQDASGSSVTYRQLQAQEKVDQQQKLELAINKTRQYYQKFNHQQAPSGDIPPDNGDSERVYCYCRRPYDELSGMIGCDGDKCFIEWFHFECVGILMAPGGNWYCSECQKH